MKPKANTPEVNQEDCQRWTLDQFSGDWLYVVHVGKRNVQRIECVKETGVCLCWQRKSNTEDRKKVPRSSLKTTEEKEIRIKHHAEQLYHEL
jgi:hypothetical protein